MRYTFVLNVSFLCVGFASGFIAPTGVPKIIEDNNTMTKIEKYVSSKNHSTVEDHRLDEILLHEHARERENNLNTRSYIFFNQGYAARKREKYDAKHHAIRPQNKHSPIQSSLIDLEKARYGEFPYRFSTGFSGKNKFNNEVLEDSYRKNLSKGQSQTNDREFQQHYLKSLNSSLLIKTKSYKDHKTPYGYDNDLRKIELMKHSKHCDKTQNSPKMHLQSNIAKKIVNKFHDIARIHLLQKSTYGNNRFISDPQKFDFNGQLISDVNHMRLGAKGIQEKGLRYNSATSNGNGFENRENCNRFNCILRAGKKYDNNKHTCDCHNKRERLSREGLKSNKTEVLVNSYSEIPDEDSKNTILNDDLLNTINKLNDTLEMYH